MKKLFLLATVILAFFLTSTYSFSENFPKNDPLPDGVMYKGVNEEQWNTIRKIGDPLDCQKKLYDFQKIQDYQIIGPEDCKDNKYCIQSALSKSKHVKLKAGIYNIVTPISIKNKVLVGDINGKTLIDAKLINTKESIILKSGIISNIQLENAFDNGIYISNNSSGSLLYRVKVGNSGANNENSRAGKGVDIWGYNNHSHCLISVELYNGYNQTSSNLRKSKREKGGNADGLSIKDGPSNITLIDVHSHHNSDDGYDFWNSGNKKLWKSFGKTKKDPIIRVFYSSALFNGKHPFKGNGDGQGFKLGGNYDLKARDHGARLIYGSASCFNKHRGFDKNVSRAKMILLGNDAKKNKQNYKSVKNKKISDDDNLIKCSMFLGD
tara:strand:- start:104 stop:1243 length:1140 start_codon:yes stop_codon:yes gene_type:complete